MRNLLSEFDYQFSGTSTLFVDNQLAISIANNLEYYRRMKHLDLRFYWLRNEVEKGVIHVKHLRTDEMPADIMTKSLSKSKVEDMVGLIGLKSCHIKREC